MFENDIAININGDSVIKNGDLGMTIDDSTFVMTMLRTHEGSWQFHPWLGIGLDRYTGEVNNTENRKQIRDVVQSKLKDYGISSKVLVLPIDDSSIICSVDIISLTGTTAVKFAFNFQSGILNYISQTEEEEEEEAMTSRTPTNIYARRK